LKNAIIVQLEKRNTPAAYSSVSTCGKVSGVEMTNENDGQDVDLFGSDSEDEELKAQKERPTDETLKAYYEKQYKKVGLMAKAVVSFYIKHSEDEMGIKDTLRVSKSIQKECLLRDTSKFATVGYGTNKLQLMSAVEYEKMAIDELCKKIVEFKDYIQQVGVVAIFKVVFCFSNSPLHLS